MKYIHRRIAAFLMSLLVALAPLPAAAFETSGAAADTDEARWEQYWAAHPHTNPAAQSPMPPRRSTSTTLAAMRARAEALVSYVWTPTTDISTWNGSSYRGLNYFPAGRSVTGVPYTLFTSEIVDWGLCSLEQYEEVASINYSTTAYCASVGAVRTGPVYGSCCADLVSEVLGGSFLYGRSPRYHNVGGVKRSPYGTTRTGQKMADIRPGDALSDVGENHIIWIGYVTETTLTVYEQTPPAARKLVLNKSDYTNSAGYFIYNGKEYSIITRSNELVSGPPRYAILTTDKHSYAPDETVNFTMSTDGPDNTLRIQCPDGTEMICEDAGTACRLGFAMSGHFRAFVETRNEEGTLVGSPVDFVIGPPTRSSLTADRPSCAAGESLTFLIDADGDGNTLWIYPPDGDCRNYADFSTERRLRFDTPGHYQAMVETRNPEGALCSSRLDFTVGPPTFAWLTADKTVYQSGETARFTVDADGDENVLTITCPDGAVREYPDAARTVDVPLTACGQYAATAQTVNPAGTCRSGTIFFTVECSHSYNASVIAPACGQEGYTLHTCAVCGDSYADAFTAPEAHDFRYTATQAPTQESEGILTGVCTVCGEETVVDLPPLSEADYAVEITAPASCSAAGSAVYTWNATSFGTHRFDAVLPALEHSFEDTVTAPTCTEPGNTLHTCRLCGASFRDSEIPALGHDWAEGAVSPIGERTDTCLRCGQTRTQTVPAAGHTHVYSAQTVAPTCTEPGFTLHVCAECGDSFRDDPVSPLGHSFGIWAQIRAADCTHDGSEQRTCAICGAQEQRLLPAAGHRYELSVLAPTCTQAGRTVHSCVSCGVHFSDSPTDPAGHRFVYSVTTPPTAGHTGTLTGECAVCGSVTRRSMPALNAADYVSRVTEEPSCAGPGTLEYTWQDPQLGDFRFTQSIPAPAHSYEASVRAPSCTGYGFTTYSCTGCGESCRGAYTAALGHDWGDGMVTLPSTQSNPGTRSFICSSCGAMTAETIPPLAHTHRYVDTAFPATCIRGGYTLFQCSCGTSYIDDEVPALGHAWDEGTVRIEPTWEHRGEMVYTCTRCGQTRTRTLLQLWDPNRPCDGGSGCAGRVFTDMPPAGNWAHDPIDWAIENEITSGTGAMTFSPAEGCTRAQVVTFLWRTAGCPEPADSGTPFTDLKQGSFYTKAVAWAVEQGITRGTDPVCFSPNATCTRAQVVTFLWRYCQCPEAQDTQNPFRDVREGAFYCDAVAWAVENGVTNGTGPTVFSPETVCTRAQVVAFLCRAVNSN